MVCLCLQILIHIVPHPAAAALDLGALTASPAAYTANTTGVTFAFFPYKTASPNAEQACSTIGGHLAAFTSAAEQSEVEQYYISKVGPCSSCCCAACQGHEHCLSWPSTSTAYQ